ncbi:hypothetical protein BaRGS_00001392 [Batillaria attramentaria]|uniref:Uncharacterized protein n=1 Tax=Batillaria attramentaria TaxID=370345 RepID=A0ABD0M7G3_9CAEN
MQETAVKLGTELRSKWACMGQKRYSAGWSINDVTSPLIGHGRSGQGIGWSGCEVLFQAQEKRDTCTLEHYSTSTGFRFSLGATGKDTQAVHPRQWAEI